MACSHTGRVSRSCQHFYWQSHWSPTQTALFLRVWHLISPTGYKVWQGTKQLICKVVTAQGHRLVPFLGGFILALRPQQAALSHLRTVKARCLLPCSFQKSRQGLFKCNNFNILLINPKKKKDKIKRIRELNWIYFFLPFIETDQTTQTFPLYGEKNPRFRAGKDSGCPIQNRGVWNTCGDEKFCLWNKKFLLTRPHKGSWEMSHKSNFNVMMISKIAYSQASCEKPGRRN